MANYGVIDLGSNSIRMLIYSVKDSKKAETTIEFKSLLNDKVMAGLCAYVQDGTFSQAGIEKAASVLKCHAKRARYFECERIEVFATAVLRNCKNSTEALLAIEKECGMPINLLSARDEAHLGFVGASTNKLIERGTLIDIGGGSTELTRIEHGADVCGVSLAQGSLSSYANNVCNIFPTMREMQDISRAIQAKFESLPCAQDFYSAHFYGIGGSVRAAAKMLMQLKGECVRPKKISMADLEFLTSTLYGEPSRFAHAATKAAPERIHTLVPGFIILKTIMQACGAQNLEICKYGVREGYLLKRMLQ